MALISDACWNSLLCFKASSVLCVGLFVGFVLFLLIVSDFLREARVNAVKRI